MKKILILILSLIILTSCSKQNNTDTVQLDKSTQTTQIQTQAIQSSQVRELVNTLNIDDYIKVLDGSSFLREYKIDNDKVFLFYNNNEEKQKEYFTENKVNGIFCCTPIRLFRDYENINTVEITIGNTKFESTREKIVDYFKINLSELRYKENWQKFSSETLTKKVINKYVNDNK